MMGTWQETYPFKYGAIKTITRKATWISDADKGDSYVITINQAEAPFNGKVTAYSIHAPLFKRPGIATSDEWVFCAAKAAARATQDNTVSAQQRMRFHRTMADENTEYHFRILD